MGEGGTCFSSLSFNECVGVGVCLLRGCVYSFSKRAKNGTEHGQSETSVGEGGRGGILCRCNQSLVIVW